MGRKVKQTLRDLSVRPRKERGQNFVINPGVIASIVQFGRPTADEDIVEIGPGLGALTQSLAVAKSLTLIEVEENFCRNLSEIFPQARVIHSDFRAVDFSELGTRLTVFGNVPYSFSTDVVFHLINFAPHIKRAVLLLQREFAERVAAEPGTSEYGSISVAAYLWADSRLGPIIDGSSFHPPASVESRVLELRFLPSPRVPLTDPAWFSSVVRSSFQKRRKKLWNSLIDSRVASREVLEKAFADTRIDPSRRAETLELTEFAKLSEAISALSRETPS